MTDLDRALSVAQTWENEAIAKGTRSTAASRRRLATIIAALAEAQEREQRVRALHQPDRPLDRDGEEVIWCDHCGMTWPCPTGAAMDGPQPEVVAVDGPSVLLGPGQASYALEAGEE
jgi:hypothetical protein